MPDVIVVTVLSQASMTLGKMTLQVLTQLPQLSNGIVQAPAEVKYVM